MPTKRVTTTTEKTTAPRRVRSTQKPAAVDREAIARRAYQRFLARGQTHGQDVQDWLEAERELTGH